MTKLCDLYEYAEQHDIDIDCFRMRHAESFSVHLGNGKLAIAIDPWKLRSRSDEACKIAHELGHCMTWSFYNRFACCDIVQRHENRADKWAIKKLVPKDELMEAINDGCTDLWQIADHFCITEDMAKKALCYYTYGNLAVDAYYA